MTAITLTPDTIHRALVSSTINSIAAQVCASAREGNEMPVSGNALYLPFGVDPA